MSNTTACGMGYVRDLPDLRDYGPETTQVAEARQTPLPPKGPSPAERPTKVDLRQWCSPIENQGGLGSCTAHAGVALLEFYERLKHKHNKHVDASRLFLYKATRNLLGWTGDTGAYLRTTLKAMVLFGIPPEMYWKYEIAKFDLEPPAFLYSFGQRYRSLLYYRHDLAGTAPSKTLASVREHLATERPSMFGFTVYSSIPSPGDGKVDIPFPGSGESVKGGHAVVAVGYDDNRQIGDCKGALLIRNSWGEAWGDKGYGWLPYAYVEHGLANDFWSLRKARFVDMDRFE